MNTLAIFHEVRSLVTEAKEQRDAMAKPRDVFQEMLAVTEYAFQKSPPTPTKLIIGRLQAQAAAMTIYRHATVHLLFALPIEYTNEYDRFEVVTKGMQG